jgi:ABC-type branched-subunit amino acid transport system substrate-binding protein
MSGTPPDREGTPKFTRRSVTAALGAAGAALLSACSENKLGSFESPFSSPAPQPQVQPAAEMGAGQVRVGLILPLSAQGNAGVAAQSMKNAAEMALDEFKNPNIQLLVKDDAGTPAGAQAGAQQALSQGAEIILGPLFAQSVQADKCRAAFR